jgi:hypothetical protein
MERFTCRDKDAEKGINLPRDEIMRYVFKSIYEVFKSAACRIAFLECKPERRLIDYYIGHDFEELQVTMNGHQQMVRYL